MRVAVVVEYVRLLPWSPSQWALHLVAGLRARGHEVIVICDGADDHAQLAGLASEVRMHRPLRKIRGRRPLAFARWAARQLREVQAQGTVSLSRLVPAGIWMPPGPTAWHDFMDMCRSRSPATFAIEALHQPWILAAVWGERKARKRAQRMGLGSNSSEGLAGAPSWCASRLDPLPPAAVAEARQAMRRTLGISEDAFVLLVGATHHRRGGTAEMFAGLGRLLKERPEANVRALVLGRETHSLMRLAREGNAAEVVQCLGITDELPALFAACDLVVLPGDASGEGGTGRLLAEALHCGKPVLADAGASGAESEAVKAIVRWVQESSSESWRDAIDQSLQRSLNIDAPAEQVSMPEWIERIELRIQRVAQ